MLFRIALIAAVVLGLLTAAANFVKVRDRITTLTQERDSEKSQKETAQSDLARTRRDLDKTKTDLAQTKQTLETATTERDNAVAENEAQKKIAASLADQLKKTKQDLGDAQAKLAAWDASGVQPEQINGLLAQLKQVQNERLDLSNHLTHLTYQYNKATNELARYIFGEVIPPEPPDLVGKVLVVDPKYDFVVLNVGQDQQVVEYGQLLVSRDGKLVAKVRVRSVDKDRSIANIMPGWQLADIFEGDTVTATQ
jgi:archaellum component FlaG (FlaF/FlaG flagellin family)